MMYKFYVQSYLRNISSISMQKYLSKLTRFENRLSPHGHRPLPSFEAKVTSVGSIQGRILESPGNDTFRTWDR